MQQTAADGSGEARLLSSCEEHLDISALRQRIMDMQQMMAVSQNRHGDRDCDQK
jgi:hypothetical protein